MSIVVLADDAFTFLVSWEFMSLSSWALVMAHHRVADNVRAGYVYLIMASFGTLALLLTFGLLVGADGGYAFADIRGAHPSAALATSILILALIGAGSAGSAASWVGKKLQRRTSRYSAEAIERRTERRNSGLEFQYPCFAVRDSVRTRMRPV
jgi:energy-converting hydrogenase Eha subunit H